MSEVSKKSLPWAKILIVAIPLWLAVSGGLGLWLHFRQQEKDRQDQRHAYRKDINADSVADDFAKIVNFLGPRHYGTTTSSESLQRMASMIEGAMGLSNIGYEVTKVAGKDQSGFTAPILMADVLRRKTKEEIWVLVPYDSPATLPRGQASASAVAASFAVAQTLVGRPLERNVRFVFLPMVDGDEQDQHAIAAQLQRLMAKHGEVWQVLLLGSMLHEGKLHAVCANAEQPMRRDLLKNVVISGDSQVQTRFCQILEQMNLPLAYLSTKPSEVISAEQEDEMLAAKKVIAVRAGDVAELLLLLANETQKK